MNKVHALMQKVTEIKPGVFWQAVNPYIVATAEKTGHPVGFADMADDDAQFWMDWLDDWMANPERVPLEVLAALGDL
jgi:hypothetical protein